MNLIYRLKGLKKSLLFLFGILICAFLFKEIYSYWNQIDFSRIHPNYGMLALVSIILLVYYLVLPIIWIQIVRGLDQNLPTGRGMIIHVSSQAAKYLPGGLWNMVGRVYLCKEQGLQILSVSTSMFLEILLNIVAGVVLMICIGFQAITIPSYVLIVVLLAIIFFYTRPSLFLKPVATLYKKWRKQSINLQVSPAKLIKWTLYYGLAWALYGAVFYLYIVHVLHMEINPLIAVNALIASWIVGFVSPIPGGLGVREGSMTYLLAQRLPYSDALLISLSSRLWLILVEIILFSSTYAITRLRRPKIGVN